MFRALFLAILLVTLAVNIIFLFATKDKPPDLLPAGSTTLVSVPANLADSSAASLKSSQRPLQRRLFLRSNDFYDYSPPAPNESSSQLATLLEEAPKQQVISARPAPPVPGADGAWRSRSSVASSELLERKKQATITTFAYDNYNDQLGDTILASVADGADSENNTTSRRPTGADNEIRRPNEGQSSPATTPAPARRQRIRLRVKSSRNHVLISLDDSIIYQSGGQAASTRLSAFEKRGPARRARERPNDNNKNANQLQSAGPNEPALANDRNDNDSQETNDQSARGIHVLVLNQFDASIMARRRFDTYTPQQDEELAHFLHQIQDGRLLVLALQDEGSFKMPASSPARRLLRALGSRHIAELGWRDMWALVLIKRERRLLETDRRIGESRAEHWRQLAGQRKDNLAEAISHSAGFAQWAQPVEIEAEVELELAEEAPLESCFASEPRRRRFCSRVEGYGRVCDCHFPAQIDFAPKPLGESRLARVPIVVVASDRPYYLQRMLRSLLQAQGVDASLITVFIDGFYEEPAEVCKLFNLRYIQHKPAGFRSARISNHYKTSLAFTFQQLFTEAPYAIIFEEDLDVAPDALVYFNSALPVLESDPSLYCISAWNDQGYEHSVGSLEQVQRVETMPGLGWLLSRELFVNELLPAWPAADRQHDWDMWIRTAAVRKGRECLIPEISRTFHFGSTGTNINSYFQRQYFSKHAFSANYLDGHEPISFANLDQLTDSKYDAMLEQLISRESNIISWPASSTLNGTESNSSASSRAERDFLCSLSNATHYFGVHEQGSDPIKSEDNAIGSHLTRGRRKTNGNERKPRTNVIFIKMIEADDFANWLELAKCWRLWDLDARGQHKATWRLHLGGRPTLIVGHPASPFSSLKPANLMPFDLHTANN